MGESLFHYRAEILQALRGHGVLPTASTRPELVHEFVSDLYRFEIRRLREQLLAEKFQRNEYAARVIALRMRYPVISQRADEWLQRPNS